MDPSEWHYGQRVTPEKKRHCPHYYTKEDIPVSATEEDISS